MEGEDSAINGRRMETRSGQLINTAYGYLTGISYESCREGWMEVLCLGVQTCRYRLSWSQHILPPVKDGHIDPKLDII